MSESVKFLEEVDEIIKEDSDKFSFDQSKYQIQQLGKDNHGDPRWARKCIMQMRKARKELEHCKKNRRLTEINIEDKLDEIQNLLIEQNTLDKDSYAYRDKQRQLEKLEAEKSCLEFDLDYEVTLIEDAFLKLRDWTEEYKKIPPIKSREEFEKAEFAYWRNRLLFEAKLQVIETGKVARGHMEALVQTGIPAECIQFEKNKLGLLQFKDTELIAFNKRVEMLQNSTDSSA